MKSFASCILATVLVKANKGPEDIKVMIKKDQPLSNTKGNAMWIKYWVFTEDDEDGGGKAYINLSSNIRMKEPEDGAIIKAGVFLPMNAGSNISYDVGLCELVYRKDPLEQEPPKISDRFFRNMNSWFKSGE